MPRDVNCQSLLLKTNSENGKEVKIAEEQETNWQRMLHLGCVMVLETEM